MKRYIPQIEPGRLNGSDIMSENYSDYDPKVWRDWIVNYVEEVFKEDPVVCKHCGQEIPVNGEAHITTGGSG
jgi:hypothetical protein